MKSKTFFIGVLVVLGIYSLAGWQIADAFQFSEEKIKGLWYSGIIGTLNIVVAFFTIKLTIKREAKTFMKMFFGGMGARFLVLIVVIISIVKFINIDQFTFILSLLILYVLYQIWEIWLINSYLRKE
ncbi:hypothetical protein DRI50_10105 [candidate division KSB1 bacterium]|nr:MAG: hypothetical protein DRI50_10105 [candidate division KSB1 bacterium]